MEVVEVLDEMLSNFDSKTFPTIICGDFTINTLKDNLLTQNFVNTINCNCFRLQPNEPTRVTDRSVSCIDHFIYQYLICDCVILEHQFFSDHYPVLFKSNIREKTETNSRLIRDTSFLHHRDKVDEYNILLNHEQTKVLKSTYCCSNQPLTLQTNIKTFGYASRKQRASRKQKKLIIRRNLKNVSETQV